MLWSVSPPSSSSVTITTSWCGLSWDHCYHCGPHDISAVGAFLSPLPASSSSLSSPSSWQASASSSLRFLKASTIRFMACFRKRSAQVSTLSFSLLRLSKRSISCLHPSFRLLQSLVTFQDLPSQSSFFPAPIDHLIFDRFSPFAASSPKSEELSLRQAFRETYT